MKKILSGLCFLALAALLILDAFHIFDPFTERIGKVSVWAILGVIALVSFIIHRIAKGKISHIFIPLALVFMLIEHNIAFLCGADNSNLINNWVLLLIAVLLTIGFSLIFPHKYHWNKNHMSISSGSSTIYVDSATCAPDYVENNLGSTLVYFENPDAYLGNGSLYVENNLGAIKIHLPKAWCARVSVENNLGSVHAPKKDSGIPITIKGENNLGSISIVYV